MSTKKKRSWRWSADARKRLSKRLKGKPPLNIINGARKPKPPQVPHNKKYVCDDRRIVKCFRYMQNRCRKDNRKCDFSCTENGFQEFVLEMGPVPSFIKKPSVGRSNHDIGYVKGNLKWEEYKFNVWKARRPERQDAEYKPDEEIPF